MARAAGESNATRFLWQGFSSSPHGLVAVLALALVHFLASTWALRCPCREEAGARS
jgi:hypothetical protein